MKKFNEEEYIPYSDAEMEIDATELAWDHALDISASIYSRLSELKMNQKDLANLLGVTPGRVSQIIKGDPGMSLKKLAEIEAALDFDLGSGFRYIPENEMRSSQKNIRPAKKSGWLSAKSDVITTGRFEVLGEAA